MLEAVAESTPRGASARSERPRHDVPTKLGVARFVLGDATVHGSKQRVALGVGQGTRMFGGKTLVQAAVDEAFDR